MTDGDMTLPPKEKTLFNQVIRSYEQKTYKKGLKLADTILKKWPNHGETLAMKGLILGHMGGDSENNVQAHVLIKQALKNDASSHVCWHVYGLLHRNDRNYADAIKCYRSALKIDVGNCQILRDLSHMQIQLRLVDEYLVTRHELLEREPHKRANWLAVITAQHYAGAHAESLETFAKYEAEIPDPSSDTDDQKLVKFEKSEGHLFKAQVLEHAGKLDSAADLLTSKASEIVDRVGWMTATARVQKKLSDFWYANVPTSNTHLEKAASLYRRLVDTMPDNHEWHLALRETLSLDEAGLVALYAELQEKHPSAEYCERAPLDFLSGDDFSKALAAYVVKPLRKGVPSLWTELGGLYSDADKTARMGAVFAKIVDSLRVNKSFPETKEVEKNPHQVFANALTLRSFHFDKVGDRGGALKTIDEAIALNVKPAILELHLAKAAFLKRSGDYQGAVAQAQVARTADTADRYLNGICVKRLLQAGDYLTAERTASLFARDGDQASNLYDMQCCWFETEAGWCHLRGNRRGRALKYFQAVVKHYKDMEEDQFDFHQYCLRKMTLRSYVEMLRVTDSVYDKPRFREAVDGLVQTYLSVHDDPPSAQLAREEAQLAKLSKEERQKIRKKQKAQKERFEKDEKEAADAAEAERQKLQEQAAKDGKKPVAKVEKPPDLDPVGDLLLQSETPLDDALAVLTLMQKHASNRPKTHNDLFSVYVRQGKVPLALRSLKRALALDSRNFETKKSVCELVVAVNSGPGDDKLLQLVKPQALELLGGVTVEQYAEALVTTAANATETKFAARAVFCVFGSGSKKTKALLAKAVNSISLETAKAKVCRETFETLRAMDADAAVLFKKKCTEKFPRGGELFQ